MSFTSEIKAELFEITNAKKHCRLAELTAYINTLCAVDVSKREMLFVSDEKRHIEKIARLLGELFDFVPGITEKTGTYIIDIKSPMQVMRILAVTSPLSVLENESLINPRIVRQDCCKGAYLRTAFLINGFVTDPSKNYHLEFSEKEYAHAYGIKQILSELGISAKITERKNRFVVYIKDSEQISDLLGIMSAHLSLLKLENIKVYKEVRNNINRKINCETSNLQKTINASLREVKAINLLIKDGVFKDLSPKLKEVANLRLENTDLSYQEIGRLLEPPLGKSGVYHRLQKVINIAEKSGRKL